jgi:uncharacterized membrane protein
MLVTFTWFSSLGRGNELLASDWAVRLQSNALWIFISFVALGAATVAFIRLKQRRYKIISLLIPPTVVLLAVITANGGNIGFWGWLLVLFSLSSFAIPLWMQAKAYE